MFFPRPGIVFLNPLSVKLCPLLFFRLMTITFRRILHAVLIASIFLTACRKGSEGGFQAGMDAYNDGDFKTALEVWRRLAEAGDPAAQTNLGFLYYEGKGVARNYEEAVKWYRMAALTGYPDAAFNLGVAYSEGKGVQSDKGQALHWYQLAGDAGYAPAQVILGNLYFRGDGIVADQKTGADWYLKAADQDDVVAQFLIANLYVTGQGVPEDLVQAYKWLLIAEGANHPDAKKTAEEREKLIVDRLGPAQVEEAEKQAKQWIAKKRKL
jgi:TPR repeat protein